MQTAVEANDRHGAHVKSETTAHPAVAVNAEAGAPYSNGGAVASETTVKQLKLQLFQELQRSRHHRDAWRTYWHTLQQFSVAKLSLDEFHDVAETLLTPEASKVHACACRCIERDYVLTL